MSRLLPVRRHPICEVEPLFGICGLPSLNTRWWFAVKRAMKKSLTHALRTLPTVCLGVLAVSCGGGSGSSPLTTDQHNPAESSNQAPVIGGQAPAVSEVGTPYEFYPQSSDPDASGELTFSVFNMPDWLSFDPQRGSLTGTAAVADVGLHRNIEIVVSDGQAQSQLPPFSIEVTMDELEYAVATGDASALSASHVIEDAILQTIDSNANLHRSALLEIFNLQPDGTARADGTSLTAIDWYPTHDSAWLNTSFGENVPLLVTNSVFVEGYDVSNQTMGVLGESSARYIALGGNPMRNYRRDEASLSSDMHGFLQNSIGWLTRDSGGSSDLNVVIAHQDQGYYFPDELAIREWLDERYPGQVEYNEQNACEGVALDECINADTDLIIISQHQQSSGVESRDLIDEASAVAATVEGAMRNGVPVLYLHHDGGLQPLGELILQLLDVSWEKDNYWQKLGMSSLDMTTFIGELDSNVAEFERMAENFRANSFAIDWSDCEGENCNENHSLATEFWDGARYARNVMTALDARKTDIFQHADKYRFDKLMALLGDYYRASVVFPMDRSTTPTLDFLRAFYADHANYQYRERVGVWSDLGTFGRADYTHVTATDRKVSHVSKRNFRSTGAYALPGETVVATREDNSDVAVEVFVNSLRSGSTHVFAESGYNRPRFLQGQRMAIEPGETIRFTSASGGPIQLGYDANDQQVVVSFNNVGEHAYWSKDEDSSSFSAKLFADEYDWAELVAPSFEVHSQLAKMIESIDDPNLAENRGSPQALVDATMRYIHNYPHVLAGFQGPGIDAVDEISRFASEHGLSIDTLDLVKHMNADQATCGYGCSGNPYDAYWSFSPLGHGDLHELGHGLERARFRFTGWTGHASTNFYSYYSKSRFYRETGGDPQCQSLPFAAVFNVLNDSFRKADPSTYVQENLWDVMSWSEGTTMFIQMMMAAQANGALQDGWHLLARLHVLERVYQRAIDNDNAWLSARDGLGMSLFDRQTARDMSREDWLLIAVSHATGFDFTDYFTTWSHDFTAEAEAQVASMNYPLMPLHYYVSSADGYCKGEGFDGSRLPLDGQQVWPDQ